LGPATVTGNLQWPRETDSFTPEADLKGNIWFARDVPDMAQTLGTEPVLLVARSSTPQPAGISPLPVDTARIPNDHLQYAITWFSLAAIWLGMSLFFLRRRRAPKTES
ncbi:MAG TPA: SURF1 family protein, partial [Sulfitobacter sp.]|nr:SURF1 family protein [Sulfitobacter sp.]